MSKGGLFGIAMALAAPIALLGILASSNEYRAMGLEGSVDCDGTLGVLMFAVPALLAYVPGFAYFASSAIISRQFGSTLVALVSGLVCLGLVANVALGARELLGAEHAEACYVSKQAPGEIG